MKRQKKEKERERFFLYIEFTTVMNEMRGVEK